MAEKIFAVLGATGNVGQILTEELLENGHTVRAQGRDPQKLSMLKNEGADAIQANLDEPEGIVAAFEGCDGAFVMIPPAFSAENYMNFQDEAGEIIKEVIVRSGVRKVVNLSSIGAQHARGTGPVAGLHSQEQRLNALPGVDVIHIRASYFMQNFAFSIPSIRKHGTVISSINGNQPIWMISTDDIGMKAAEYLEDLSFKDKSTFEFVGPRQISHIEASCILGQVLARPELKYVQISYRDEQKSLINAGMSPASAALFVELHQGINEGLFTTTQPISDEHKGSIPFESFAHFFAERMKKHEEPAQHAHA